MPHSTSTLAPIANNLARPVSVNSGWLIFSRRYSISTAMTKRQISAGSDSLLCGSTALAMSAMPKNTSSLICPGRSPQRPVLGMWLGLPTLRWTCQAEPSNTTPPTRYIHVAQVAGVGIIES